MKHKLRIYLIASTALLFAVGFLFFRYSTFLQSSEQEQLRLSEKSKGDKDGKSGKGDRTIPVSVYLVDYEISQVGIPSVGTLLPFEEVTLASEIAGKVERINFEEGAIVRKDELLVKINDDDLQAQLKRAQAQHKQFKDKLDRSRTLFAREAISREVLEQSEADFLMVEADIELIKVKIDRTEIKAPFDGTVGFRNIALGSYLQPGTLITRLVDDSRLRLEFSIPEKYTQLVRKGVNVAFKTVDWPEYHKASIYAIDPKVDVATRTIGIRALFLNTYGKLKSGMSAAVNVGQQRGTTLQIPTQAIVPENNNMKVWVVRDGKAISAPVVTGNRGESLIEVKAGLAQGDSVIITGLLHIKEGSKLLINP